MKSLKIKFQNKKRKLNAKTEQKQATHVMQDNGHIDFLLREDTDAQKAKNQLRKASEQVFHGSLESKINQSWSNQVTDLPFYWLDEAAENQLKNMVKSKTGNSQVDLSPETKHSIISCLSQGQIRARSQIAFLKNNQNMQQNLFSKKSSICYLRTEKSQQKPRKKDGQQYDKIESEQRKKGLNATHLQSAIEKNQLLIEELKRKSEHARNLSTVVLKRSRVIMVTPKIKQRQQHEVDQPLNKNKKINGITTVYFKVPDFNSKQNLKRAVTVHCESHSKQSFPLQKKNFYLKKTNTICVVQKQMEEANKCISLSNYKTMGYAKKKSKMTLSSCEPINKKSTTELENTKQPEVSGQNLKENLNRLSLEKAAKTMMLRQEFERLRKLLKKQTVVEFQIDQDSPIRITKL